MAVRIGRYEVIRAIASGGMATVHLARTVGEGGFERLVAIKVMHPHIATDPAFVAMFLDEARLAARIRHPNVVATHDVQKSPAGVFLVMDYIDGASLQHILRSLHDRDRVMPLDITLRIIIDALTGLHAAHELCGDNGEPLNLVHRDISPDNILVGNDGLARITDFGVARAESRISSTSGAALKGKLAFMAPERIMHGSNDRRSDIYAAGATMWETIVGKRLFEADDNGMLITKIVVGAVCTPRALGAQIPEAVEAVVMRSINRDPNARYPTAAAFADALEEAARVSNIIPASPRRVAAFLKELKSEGIVATQRLPNAQAIAAMMAQGTPALGTSSRIRTQAGRHGRGRIIAALAAGAFMLGILLTILFAAVSGGSSTTAKPSAAPTAEDPTPPALAPPAVITVPDTTADPGNALPSSSTAPPAAPSFPSGAVTNRKFVPAPTTTVAPAVSTRPKEFDPGGL
ncbi:MAG: serine/threonine protein kinase [Polyangiaceae bacterium]|nr:serine/threonine protein kinase [Polyangiaceae bacterium]